VETKEKRTPSRSATRRRTHRQAELVACSLCLRVLRSAGWVEARDLIRGLRTFEHEAVPRLRPALCDHCEQTLRARRGRLQEQLAA